MVLPASPKIPEPVPPRDFPERRLEKLFGSSRTFPTIFRAPAFWVESPQVKGEWGRVRHKCPLVAVQTLEVAWDFSVPVLLPVKCHNTGPCLWRGARRKAKRTGGRHRG